MKIGVYIKRLKGIREQLPKVTNLSRIPKGSYIINELLTPISTWVVATRLFKTKQPLDYSEKAKLDKASTRVVIQES